MGRTTSAMPGLDIAEQRAWQNFLDSALRVYATLNRSLVDEHHLTLNDVRFPRGRIEDWATLAVANALTGHDVDARSAWFVALALTGDLQHLCDAAVRAEASHGERVRPSVQALLQRARSSAAYGRCEVAAAPKESRAKAQAKPAPRPRRTIP